MRIFIAGATGVIGRPLVHRLIEKGHTITAMTRSQERAEGLAALGAEPTLCDVYDAQGVAEAVRKAAPEVVIHQLTALPSAIHPRRLEKQLAANDRIRVEGTRNLVRAAVQAGARRLVAQSIAFAYAPQGGSVKSEDAPLWLDAPWPWRRTVEAIASLERQVTSAEGVEGVVLRYGYFYGPGTAYASDGSMAALARQRQFPVVGRGTGVFSFLHIDDAVEATVVALEGRPGIYNIVDDAPSSVRDWLPVYTEALGAPPPRRVFPFLARLAAGKHGLYTMTEQRGAANAKAKAELGWFPSYGSWRTGFPATLGATREPAAPHSDPAAAHV